MTASDDNDELEGAFVKQSYVLHFIKFKNVCLCMIMYMWELFTRVEFSVELYILHEGTYIWGSVISVPTILQVAFKIFTFSKISTCYLKHPGCDVYICTNLRLASFLWDIGKRRRSRSVHITKVESNQVLRCCSLEI